MEQFLIYLLLALIGLIVLVLGGILVTAIVDAIRIAYTKHPSRFQRADRLESFQHKKLPEIAERLGMELQEEVPSQLQRAMEATRGTLGSGRVRDVLTKSGSKGTLCLCNLKKNASKSKHWQDGSRSEWTKIEEYTCLVFMGGKETKFPSFNLTPNEHSLMIKLFNQRMFGAVRFEDDPEFHRQILIGTTEPDDVRPLLTPRVRDVLKNNSDLRTAVYGSSIIVYDYGNVGKGIRFANLWRKNDGAIVDCEVIAAEDWPRFYEAAFEVIDALRSEQRRT